MSEQLIDIVKSAKKFVEQLLTSQLAEGMAFHDWEHTQGVWKAAQSIAKAQGVKKEQRKLLEIAALFHDTGYTKTYVGHEEASIEIAKSFLLEHNLPGDQIADIGAMIKSTRMDVTPTTDLEKILCDADMSHVAGKNYFERIEGLRKEWVQFCDKSMTDEEWDLGNFNFLAHQDFHTTAGEKLFQAGKDKNLKKMKAAQKAKNASSLTGSKSAQMMFKTALRNHIDLTNLADNKANIMLSINAIIITISLPYIPSYVAENHHMLIPASLLIITCLSSVITATLATRPIAMPGTAPVEKIRNGTANLFFFGNFYKMSQSEYYAHLSEVIANEEVLEISIISDLYHLGASMGKKYKLLRLCYTIFMYGMAATVLSVLITQFF